MEFNGYTGTHIPDILDEAVWLVDYFKNNGLYRVNEKLKITAEASPQDVRVDFYLYNEKIGSDNTEPFELLWIPTEEGMTEIMVKAVDDRGLEVMEKISIAFMLL